MSETITLTFGDCGENHVGMQKIGALAECGFSVEELLEFKAQLEQGGAKCEFVQLDLPGVEVENAGILIVRKGIDFFLAEKKHTADELFEEQKALDWDMKAYMYGRVVNKNARYNLCYSDEAQEPDYEKKKGRIVSFADVPVTRRLKRRLQRTFGKSLIGEGNRYYDVRKCGIGYHGDTERRIVIGCRLGAEMPLHFNWFYKGEPIGKNYRVMLQHGDVYAMSEKAVGFDWKKRSKYTLRHSAGCAKFTKL